MSGLAEPHSNPRPRKTARRYEPDGGLHYLTFSCYKRLPLLGKPRLRDEFVENLAAAKARHRFKLVAWVIMPEHIHIILSPTAWLATAGKPGDAGGSVPAILNGIKKPFSQELLGRWRKVRWNNLASVTDSAGRLRFWQSGGGFDRNIRDQHELGREVRYIHKNPVKRELVDSPTDWPWSSARWYAGWSDQPLQIDQVYFDRCEFPGRFADSYV